MRLPISFKKHYFSSPTDKNSKSYPIFSLGGSLIRDTQFNTSFCTLKISPLIQTFVPQKFRLRRKFPSNRSFLYPKLFALYSFCATFQYPYLSTPISVPLSQYPYFETSLYPYLSTPICATFQYPCFSTPVSVPLLPLFSTPVSVPLSQYPSATFQYPPGVPLTNLRTLSVPPLAYPYLNVPLFSTPPGAISDSAIAIGIVVPKSYGTC